MCVFFYAVCFVPIPFLDGYLQDSLSANSCKEPYICNSLPLFTLPSTSPLLSCQLYQPLFGGTMYDKLKMPAVKVMV